MVIGINDGDAEVKWSGGGIRRMVDIPLCEADCLDRIAEAVIEFLEL